MRDYLEVSTAIGCPVQCLRYCPQEVLSKRYKGPEMMTPEGFRTIISTVPKNVAIKFAGFSEPFTNPKTAELVRIAHDHGHPTQLFSTLVGCTYDVFQQIKDIPFDHILLHLPDSKGISNIPDTPEYRNILQMFLRTFDCNVMTMGGLFCSHRHEDAVRGTPYRNHWYPITCDKFQFQQPIVLPNGNVYGCCHDFGLEDCIGNLITGSWRDLPKARRFSICRGCNFGMFSPLWHIKALWVQHQYGGG